MKYTFEELKGKLFEHVQAVYTIFCDFFGENLVDLQLGIPDENIRGLYYQNKDEDGNYNINSQEINNFYENTWYSTILVYWPHVTVTNEYEKSIDIEDLYAQIKITNKGTIPYEMLGFKLNRAKYSSLQFQCNYLHSHVPSIPKADFTLFQKPCLGSGPIRNTIMSLKNEFDETVWMLFCQELALYVTVESIEGVPYMRLETVGTGGRITTVDQEDNYSLRSYLTSELKIQFNESIIQDFIKYYIEHGHMVFSFKDGEFQCGLPFFDYMVDVSNAAIDFFNSRLEGSILRLNTLYDMKILMECLVKGRKFYRSRSNTHTNLSQYIGKHVCYFKGRDIKLQIYDNESDNIEAVTILSPEIANFIKTTILLLINKNYRNEHNRTENESSSTTHKDAIIL